MKPDKTVFGRGNFDGDFWGPLFGTDFGSEFDLTSMVISGSPFSGIWRTVKKGVISRSRFLDGGRQGEKVGNFQEPVF